MLAWVGETSTLNDIATIFLKSGKVQCISRKIIRSDLEIFLCVYLDKIIQEKVKVEHHGFISSSSK